MPKSSRRGRGRVDVIEVFSPRRSGPWHLLRAVRSRVGFAVAVLAVLVLLVRHQLGVAATVAALYVVLLVLSFALVWQVVGLLIRSRAELFVLAVGLGAAWSLSLVLAPAWAGVTLVALGLVAYVLPWSRRYLVSRVWCVVDRHRLRLCLRQTKVRTMNMDGSLPLMLWARPTTIGERVWVWVRAGSSGEDIEDATEYIAPACYARSARVERVRRLTTLVAIDIVRRDPLANPAPVTSPLAKLTRLVTGHLDTAVEGAEAIRPATLTDITAEVVPAAPHGHTRGATSASRPVASSVSPAPTVVVGGEDVSDYID